MKLARLMMVVLAVAGQALAQGACKQDIALNRYGQPAGGAVVRVCDQGATGTPCNSLHPIYRDAALTDLIVGSVFNADQFGNYAYCAAPGYVKEQTTYGGTTFTKRDVTLAGPNSSTGINAQKIQGVNINTPSPSLSIPTFDGTTINWGTKPITDMRDFVSGTVAGQIDATCAAFAGLPGAMTIAAVVGAGNSTAGIADSCGIMDVRGLTAPDAGANEGQAFRNSFLFRSRYTVNHPLNMGTMQIYTEPFSGGINCLPTGPPTYLSPACPVTGKSNYYNLNLNLASRTLGQHTSVNLNNVHYSNGDTFGVGAVVQSFGGINAGGDEGTVGMSGVTYQGDTEFSGTITGISGLLITFGSASNTYSRGEYRPLLNATTAYTTGTVSGIAGAVVTGVGSAWNTLGAGSHYNPGAGQLESVQDLWFCLDSETRDTMRYCVPVSSVDSNTQITLVTSYSALTSTGNYHLYKGSLVSSIVTAGGNAATGQLNVFSAANFSVGNTFFQPVDYRFFSNATKGVTWQHVGQIQAVGHLEANIGTLPGLIGYYLTGPWQTGFVINTGSAITGAGMSFGYAGAAPAVYLSDINDNQTKVLLAVNKNTGTGTATVAYDRQHTYFKIGQAAYVCDLTGSASFGFAPSTCGTTALRVSAFNLSTDALELVPGNNTTSMVWGSQFGAVYYNFNTHAESHIGMGIISKWYSGDAKTGTGLTASINGATGAASFGATSLTSVTIGSGGTTVSFDKAFSDTPGAITVNAQTCTDRSIVVAGISATARISVGAAYALEANLGVGAGQADAGGGNAHYRICNPTAGNITLAAGATFTIEVRQ